MSERVSHPQGLLAGQVAVVTGGGRGIGLGIAEHLASLGAAIAIADIDAATALKAAEQIKARGSSAVGLPMDVADEGSIERFYEGVLQDLGPASILVHAAAIWSSAQVRDMPVEQWEAVQSVNVRGTFLVCKRAARDMAAAGYGRIVNIASTVFLSGGPTFAHYVASKGAVIGFSRAFAVEVASEGITVNCVAPGLIGTENAIATHGKEGVDAIVRMQPVKRVGTPQDIAEAVAFFVSPGAGFTTGQTLYVNGGTRFS